MTKLPSTTQRLIPEVAHGRRSSTKGVVVHTMEGTLVSADAWFRNPQAGGVGAHAGFSDNAVYQWADLNAICWHAPGANHDYIGFEHEGRASYTVGTWLTHKKMLLKSANRLGWVCRHYHLGKPTKGVNVFGHVDFPAGGHHDPGTGWPWKLYIGWARLAYATLVATRGKTWR